MKLALQLELRGIFTIGAGGGRRTHTPLRATDFESYLPSNVMQNYAPQAVPFQAHTGVNVVHSVASQGIAWRPRCNKKWTATGASVGILEANRVCQFTTFGR